MTIRVTQIPWRLGPAALLALTFMLPLRQARAQSYSVCADFACITVDAPQQIPTPTFVPHPMWNRPAGNYMAQVRAQQEAERQAQEAERERKRREQKLREEIAWRQHLQQVGRAASALRQLQQLQAVDAAQQHLDERITARVDGALSAFERGRRQAERDHRAWVARLMHEVDSDSVPTPRIRYYPRLLFLGVTGTPDEALRMQHDHARDPFDGRQYDGVFGFGWTTRVGVDLLRAGLDHLLLQFGEGTLSQRLLSQAVDRLQDATIGDLVCHSNGCAIAEALIQAGVIHVKNLEMLGGDGSLMNLNGISRMAQADNVNVSVYATLRDPVPLIPQGWDIREWVDQWTGTPREWLLNGVDPHNPTYQVLGLAAGDGPPSPVKVELLSAPGGADPSPANVLANHAYSTYAGLINAHRLAQQAQ